MPKKKRKKDFEWEEITLKVRKNDKGKLLNNYLAFVLKLVEDTTITYVGTLSKALLDNQPHAARTVLTQFKENIDEVRASLEQLEELVEIHLLLDSPVGARVMMEPGVPISATELNQRFTASGEDIKKRKEEALKKKEGRAKTPSKKKAKK